ncbi:transposase domain-containing protein [Cohaesibacter sp. CAU 1516]|nr:transposase domain-containing protein [Cohaesibacter sp. CAU 1516]
MLNQKSSQNGIPKESKFRAKGMIASLIGTCKLNGIEPFDYLKTSLERIANNHPQSRIEELLPWATIPSTHDYSSCLTSRELSSPSECIATLIR